MSGYMLSVYLTAAVTGILSLALYREGGDKATKFALGVLVAYAVVMPLADVTGGIFERPEILLPDSPELNDSAVSEAAKAAFEEGIERLVKEEFSLGDGTVTVVMDGFLLTEMRAEKIRVYLSGKGVFVDARAVERLINKYGFGECVADFEI